MTKYQQRLLQRTQRGLPTSSLQYALLGIAIKQDDIQLIERIEMRTGLERAEIIKLRDLLVNTIVSYDTKQNGRKQ